MRNERLMFWKMVGNLDRFWEMKSGSELFSTPTYCYYFMNYSEEEN